MQNKHGTSKNYGYVWDVSPLIAFPVPSPTDGARALDGTSSTRLGNEEEDRGRRKAIVGPTLTCGAHNQNQQNPVKTGEGLKTNGFER